MVHLRWRRSLFIKLYEIINIMYSMYLFSRYVIWYYWYFPCLHVHKLTQAESGTVVTVSAMFRAEILNFLAKQNLQKGSSSSSPNTLSAFLGPEIMLSLWMISCWPLYWSWSQVMGGYLGTNWNPVQNTKYKNNFLTHIAYLFVLKTYSGRKEMMPSKH